MTGVDHGDTGSEVDIAFALDIPDFGVQRVIDLDLGLHANATRDGIGAAAGDFGVLHEENPLAVRRHLIKELGQPQSTQPWFR
jgi:hypothetical protein